MLTDIILLIYVAKGIDDITTHDLVLCTNKTSADTNANYTFILVSTFLQNFFAALLNVFRISSLTFDTHVASLVHLVQCTYQLRDHRLQ